MLFLGRIEREEKEDETECEGRRTERKRERKKERDEERRRDTSGHEGERQIKFDRKLHEIVGEPRWSAPVL